MFSSLYVKNFAIIDHLQIDFKSGMTVLTGETGAGKSLIIDATHLLLGTRLTTKVVRLGADKAIIEGIFEDYCGSVKLLLDEFGIEELDENQLIIRREIYANGKSMARINGMAVTISQLEKIGNNLMDIHTQNDTKKLFDSRNYFDFIDNDESKELLAIYLISRKKYLNSLAKYQELENSINTDLKQLEFSKYQLEELKSAHLNVNEEEEIQNELAFLNNFENINQLLVSIKNSFETNNILDGLYDANYSIEKMTQYDEKYQELFNRADSIYYDLKDILATIKADYHNLEFDEERLNELNERSQFITDLKRKYHLDIEELILYQEKLEEQIKLNENYDLMLEDAKHELSNDFKNVQELALKLEKVRKQNAKQLVEDVISTLNDLMLEKVKFEIHLESNLPKNEFDKSKFKADGISNVDFLISFNAGQPLESLSKVASGGEMSRIMLALKVHLTKQLGLSTIIFDEIDSGISRNVAFSVALKMKEISKNCQVLAITHLPIVASFANQHIYLSKKATALETIVEIKELTKDERIDELSMMLSPNSHQNDAIKTIALEMLENSNN